MRNRPNVVFYTKRGCPMCDEARDMLHEAQVRVPFVLREIDIMSDLGLYERHKTNIPVVTVDRGPTLWGRIDEGELYSCLKEAAESHRE